jgi:hypothetical protein
MGLWLATSMSGLPRYTQSPPPDAEATLERCVPIHDDVVSDGHKAADSASDLQCDGHPRHWCPSGVRAD